MPEINVEIKGEADRLELIQVLSAFGMQTSDNFLTNQDIKKCLDLLPSAIGYCLKNSEALPDGSKRIEIHNGLIVRAHPREAKEGEAFGHDYTSPAHYDFYVKFEGAALSEIAEQMGMPGKNG